jgi:hypothetical protein
LLSFKVSFGCAIDAFKTDLSAKALTCKALVFAA